MSVYATVLAGGSGLRFAKNANTNLPKQFAKIGEKTLLEMSCEAFENCPKVDGFVVVMNPNHQEIANSLIGGKFSKLLGIVAGGRTRVESSYLGLKALTNFVNFIQLQNAKVLIHDAVRPWVTRELIARVIEKLEVFEVVQPIVSVSETIVKRDHLGVWETQNREDFATVQTQGFNFSTILHAFESLPANKFISKRSGLTDDISVWQQANPQKHSAVVEGDLNNKKVTVKRDL